MTNIEISRRVKFVIYYGGQIYNTESKVVFVGVKSMEFVFNSTVKMHELRTKIRKKAGGLTRGRITRLQCIYLTSIDPYRYELSDVNSETHLKTIISSYTKIENTVIELYVEFVNTDASGPSSTSISVNTGTETEAESPTTGLCCGFSGLLQSGYYNVPKTSIGKQSSISNIDLNFWVNTSQGTNEESDVSEEEGVVDTNEVEESAPNQSNNVVQMVQKCHASIYHDVRVLKVKMEYPNKDSFLAAFKRYNIKNYVNYYMTKSHFEKFEEKCVMKDRRCIGSVYTRFYNRSRNTFRRYQKCLLLAIAQDGNRKILSIEFATTPKEMTDDCDFFLSRLCRLICLLPDICVILDRKLEILSAIYHYGSL
ncbi:hypothetical protein J1N35_011117 [Gossypium stocksii]|uniref:Transposase MuDR plant domain-containing protein n=1 Tax=Gossypium stocksii TaxID=47602 RepID=A0A9D3W1J7_9ROSI|nr:hypothetical protein J1N35_011117 [Gossypium stocksii]